MSNWRDQLQPASFRGVPFHVDSDQTPVGRKTQTHEFVQRDKPEVEDLGRKTREFKLTAFVIGADYFDKRDALLDALDKPGPGELVHPWFGKLTVTAGECSVSHERREGGMARFDLLFIVSEEKGFPKGTANTAQQLKKGRAGLWESAAGSFDDAMSKVNAARVKASALRTSLLAPFEVVKTKMSDVAGVFGTATGFADSLLSSPAGFLGSFNSLAGSASSLTNYSGFSSFGDSLQALLGRAESAQSLGSYSPAGGADTAQAAKTAQRLVRDALLVQIADEAAAMPVLQAPPAMPVAASLEQQVAAPVERPDVAIADDVLLVRDAVSDAFWQAALEADHEQFQQLEELRKLVHRHLTAVAAGGVRLVTVTPRAVEPALVLAYRQYGDATRAAEIVTRNRLNHPGFVPPAALQVARE